MKTRVACGLLLSLALAACGEDAPPPPPKAPDSAAPAAAPAPRAGGAVGAKGAKVAEPADLPPLPTPDIQERDFLESPANRDPFRSFADLFIVKPAAQEVKIQRDVLIQKHSLEQLKV